MKFTVVAALLVTGLPCPALSQEPATPRLLGELDRIGRRIVEAGCPRPIKVASTIVPNRHDPQVKDEVRRLTCPGHESGVYVSHADAAPRVLPLELTLRTPRGSLPGKLQVGAAGAGVQATLGRPHETGPGWLSYVLPSDAGNDTVTFRTANGRVSAIVWAWDID